MGQQYIFQKWENGKFKNISVLSEEQLELYDKVLGRMKRNPGGLRDDRCTFGRIAQYHGMPFMCNKDQYVSYFQYHIVLTLGDLPR